MSLINNTSMLTNLLNKVEAFPRSDVKTLETMLIERSLDKLELDSIERIVDYAFYGCGLLSFAHFPKCTEIGNNAFCQCDSLISVSFPECTTIKERAFMSCYSLKQLSFPNCTFIGMYAFAECSALTSLYLMASSLCTLDNFVLSSTNITSTTGSIFVPASLVTVYKSASNWSEYSDRIFGVG